MLRRLARSLHVGQTFPDLKLVLVTGKDGKYSIERGVQSSSFFANKKVVVVGFPGAFTPTCQLKHLPEYIQNEAVFAAKATTVLGLAVNDPFVMKEFAEELKGSIGYIADADATLTRALDAGADFSDASLGYRTRRFSIVVENGQITQVNDEQGGKMTDLSRAETVLKTI